MGGRDDTGEFENRHYEFGGAGPDAYYPPPHRGVGGGHPPYPPPPGYPYGPYPHRPRGKFLGLSVWGWVFIAVLLLVGMMFAGCWLVGSTYPRDSSGNEWGEEVLMDGDVVIESGGIFSVLVDERHSDGEELRFEVGSVGDARFDLLLMNEHQYRNLYSSEVGATSFSTMYQRMDVISVEDSVDLSQESGNHHLVVDNTDIELVDADAVPDGSISVHVKVVRRSMYAYD